MTTIQPQDVLVLMVTRSVAAELDRVSKPVSCGHLLMGQISTFPRLALLICERNAKN